jgi:hypothetical protein
MDLKAQRAQTEATFLKLASELEIPETIQLKLQFVPLVDSSNRRALSKTVGELGYTVEWLPDDEDTPEEDGYLEVTTLVSNPSADLIWLHEERLTLLAAKYDFAADGWGLLVPRD